VQFLEELVQRGYLESEMLDYAIRESSGA
jgi:hypothetical protein